jgi:transposase-like protein
MEEGKRQKRPRRSFTDDFKTGVVRLVLDEGKTVPQVARDLDLTESSVRNWVDRARADRGKGKVGVLTSAERLLVRDGGVEREDEDVALDGLVEPGRLDDLVVGGASRESDAEPVPGHLADVDHLVDVVSHEYLWTEIAIPVGDRMVKPR